MPEGKEKLIYVCSAYGGREENYKRALFYGRYVVSKGYIPIIPHTMLHGILNDKVTEERELGLEAGRILIKTCGAVWVFASEENETVGMRREVEFAESIGVPVVRVKDSYSISREAEQLSILFKEYESLTNKLINRAICDDIIHYLNEGISEALMLEAMKCAAKKHAPWNYTAAILKRCLYSGIRTLEEFKTTADKKKDNDFASYDLDAFEKMLNEKD